MVSNVEFIAAGVVEFPKVVVLTAFSTSASLLFYFSFSCQSTWLPINEKMSSLEPETRKLGKRIAS